MCCMQDRGLACTNDRSSRQLAAGARSFDLVAASGLTIHVSSMQVSELLFKLRNLLEETLDDISLPLSSHFADRALRLR